MDRGTARTVLFAVLAVVVARGQQQYSATTRYVAQAAEAQFTTTNQLTMTGVDPVVTMEQSKPVADAGVLDMSTFSSGAYNTEKNVWFGSPNAVLFSGSTTIILQIQDFPAYDPTQNTWKLNVTVLQPQLANLKYQDGIAAAVVNKVTQKTPGVLPVNLVASLPAGSKLQNVALMVDVDYHLLGNSSAIVVPSQQAAIAMVASTGAPTSAILQGSVCTCVSNMSAASLPPVMAPAGTSAMLAGVPAPAISPQVPEIAASPSPQRAPQALAIQTPQPQGQLQTQSIPQNPAPAALDNASPNPAATPIPNPNANPSPNPTPAASTDASAAGQDPGRPVPPGPGGAAPPPGTYNVITHTTDCAGATTDSYSFVYGQPGPPRERTVNGCQGGNQGR